jgi:hypothetical protein
MCFSWIKVVPSSHLIDKGVDVGFEFNGRAPDLGAFESTKQSSDD